MHSIVQLTAAEVHVWLTFCEAIRDECLLGAYRELLDASEKEEASRFYAARDRRRCLVTRALVRTVLSHYASVDPKDWIFAANAYGRPHIVNTQAEGDSLSFSVSHTEGLIVVAVANGRFLGVDVENFATLDISMDIADHYFASPEVAALHEGSPIEQRDRFFEYWTLKEAYIKARGMGFSLPLDKFSFHFGDGRAVDLAIDPELGDDSSRWQLWQFRPTSEHLVALCAGRVRGQFSDLLIRETIPMVSERIVAPEFLRTCGHQPRLESAI